MRPRDLSPLGQSRGVPKAGRDEEGGCARETVDRESGNLGPHPGRQPSVSSRRRLSWSWALGHLPPALVTGRSGFSPFTCEPPTRYLLSISSFLYFFLSFISFVSLFTIYLFIFIFERQNVSREGAERGRHRIRSRLQPPSCLQRARCGAQTHEL